ncbi:BRCT domain-containing protein [Herbiconiux sp. P15]|uniref:BRCT domain-containing protein n=1 Tax=Herbiconiux liukaitaii TaxID=3342799 RepID=UPI0035BAF149
MSDYSRREVQKLVAGFGASVSSNVTKKTSLVVMGGFDPATLEPGATLSSGAACDRPCDLGPADRERA